MDYNTERAKLKIPEYGRTIQQMVDYAVTIADRQERNHCAHTIIQIMGTMFPAPGQKDPQQNTTLWDQLAIMSDFKLDIDWPFPITSAEELQTRPTPLHYPQTPIRLRHYGRLVENFLDKLKELEPDEDRNAAIVQVADQMMRDLPNGIRMPWKPTGWQTTLHD